MRVGGVDFAELSCSTGDTVARLIHKGCQSFKSWGSVSEDEVKLFLLAAPRAHAISQGAPISAADFSAPLSSLSTIGVGGEVPSGSCLLARFPSTPGLPLAAAEPAPDLAAMLGSYLPKPLTAQQQNIVRFNPAFEDVRATLIARKFTERDVPRTLMRLGNLIATSTRHRFLADTGLVLDGPVGVSAGQGSTAILHALDGSRAVCAKVGPAADIRREWAVNQAVHSPARAAGTNIPTIILAERCADLPTHGSCALVLPALPLSLADAALALPPWEAAAKTRGGHRPRDALALGVALSGLAAVHAFSVAGWAHGDIKPANILLSSAPGGVCVLCDLGTAARCGEEMWESSHFNLNEPRTASLTYDLVCLGSTLATLQYDLVLGGGSATRASLLAEVEGMIAAGVAGVEGEAGSPPPPPPPPAALAALWCLRAGGRKGGEEGGPVQPWEVKAFVGELAGVAAEQGFTSPSLEDVWPGYGGGGGE